MSKKREMKVLRKEDSNFDKILAYHINPDEFPLSDTLNEIRLRWDEIFTLRLNGFTPSMIVKRWKQKNLSPAQAYIDIRNSESLFGNVLKSDKEGMRVLWLSWAQDYLMRCRQKGNQKDEKFALKLIADYGDFKGEDNPEFNPEKLANVEIRFDLPKEYLELLKQIPNTGVDDFNNLKIEDIDFEELDDAGK